MKLAAPKGVFDIYPVDETTKEEWKESSLWRYVEEIIHEVVALFDFREVRTPVFEKTELWQRSVGESTDIVSKEMYTFEDRANRSMSLRPEGTAPVIRAFLEHSLHLRPGLQKLYYLAPMFRYERQQAGRYRQHHQFGVEVIGDPSPERDVELIELLFILFKRLGLKGLKLDINSIGDSDSRQAYRDALVAYLTPRLEELSGDSQLRLKTNPLRILDSKDARDREVLKDAPSILEHLTGDCATHFAQVQSLLANLEIPFTVNARLVRGLDYYTRTVFEITAEGIGSQNALAGGGRYDGLIKTLGGPDLPALGFGSGIERLLQTMIQQQIALPPKPAPTLLLIPLGEAARIQCFTIVCDLRRAGVSAEIDLSGKKLKGALRFAVQQGARYVAVVGDDELKQGTVQLKKMATHETIEAPLNDLKRMANG